MAATPVQPSVGHSRPSTGGGKEIKGSQSGNQVRTPLLTEASSTVLRNLRENKVSEVLQDTCRECYHFYPLAFHPDEFAYTNKMRTGEQVEGILETAEHSRM